MPRHKTLYTYLQSTSHLGILMFLLLGLAKRVAERNIAVSCSQYTYYFSNLFSRTLRRPDYFLL